MDEAREAILARVRAALADVPEGEGLAVPRAYRRTSRLERSQLVELFAERILEYRATVRRVDAGGAAAVVAAICVDHGVARLAVPADLPEPWRPVGVECLTDPPSTADLDTVDGVLTGCALAIAETGTIALDGGAGQGRRALTLVPDLHICLVSAERIVGSVPEAVALLGAEVRARRAPITLISGPSATSDIELKRVEGVHGPRRLEVVIVT